MNVYQSWNDAIAAHFFSDSQAGRPVYLYVNEDVIGTIGKRIGHDRQHFVWTVDVVGPDWARHQGLCQRALEGLYGWRDRGLKYPPYLAYLALFVLAAGLDGDFAPHAYYPRLRRLLDMPFGGMLASFDRMLDLWDDLERWSSHDMQGSIGVFQARLVGSFIHVGLPIAQRVLTDADRKNLPRIFANAGLDPTSVPNDRELLRLLRIYGIDQLQPRTLSLLRSDEVGLISFVVDIARDELLNWDGTVPPDEVQARETVRGSLRLTLRTDPTAQSSHFELRCRLNREFPEAGLVLHSSNGAEYHCVEAQTGWSSPLAAFGGRADGTTFDWRRGTRLVDPSGWEFVLPPSDVRLFVSGRSENLQSDVEVHELPRGKPFRVAFHEDAWLSLRPWLENGCIGFQHVVVAGLPPGWSLVRVTEAITDEGLRETFPRLAFSSIVRTHFVGGVRAGAGNNYFGFALPRLLVEAAEPGDVVLCDGALLTKVDSEGRYFLSSDLRPGQRALIEVKRHDLAVRRQSLFVADEDDWRIPPPSVASDELGKTVPTTALPMVVGAYAAVSGSLPEFRPYPFLLKEARARANRELYLIGRRPGQVIEWPAAELPDDWIPVWAIRKTHGKEVLFCGRGIEDSAPDTAAVGPDIQRWKQLIWTNRQRVDDPSDPTVRRLWKRYQVVARDL